MSRRAVIDLGSTRPVWSVPAETIAELRRAFGRAFEVLQVKAPASSDGDGRSASDEAVIAARGAEVYVGWGAGEGVIAAATGTLRWVHTAAAGVSAGLARALAGSGVVLTNSRGVHAEPMADWILAALAACARGFPAAAHAQAEERWAKDVFTDGSVPVRELGGMRIGIVGLGGIGRATALRCAALGMEVRAVRRHAGLRRPRGVRWVGGRGDLVRLARRSDALVIAAPATPETERLIDARVLDALPRGAFVINVARGSLLDEAALLERLADGRIGACALDVFATEPLPPGHAFWHHPRVLLTPHVSAVSPQFWRRESALLTENIRRYRDGRRLRNVVNLEMGY